MTDGPYKVIFLSFLYFSTDRLCSSYLNSFQILLSYTFYFDFCFSLSEAHESGYTIHPGEIKMYQDLKRYFWWPGMKQDVTQYVEKCQIYQQVKANRHKTARFFRTTLR
jgi:Integrase zinc binding domain